MAGTRARDHLTAIANSPRPAGGAAESDARGYCARLLREAGFAVREDPFEYSAFPGRYATSVFGLVSTLVLVVAMSVAARGDVGRATATLIAGGILLAGGAAWVARAGVLHAPFARRQGVNLSATRGGDSPPVWLVAHLDTKSQPVPMLLRATAIALHGLTWGAALALCVVGLFGGLFSAGWSTVGAVAVATGLPIVASVVGDQSAGAVDDASGAAVVLIAAAALPRELPVGVLLTSAEELGLAGARAWLGARPAAVALNCDGLDDVGDMLLMYSGAKPTRLLDAFERAARTEGKQVRSRRLLPGILVDAVAFADAGWEAITLSRGTLATLARIHTKRDNLGQLTGAGIDDAAPLLVRAAQELS
jgi:hypothetical protein